MDKSSLCYTTFFCEENIWKLLESIQGNHSITATDVLFIINPYRHIAIYEQTTNNYPMPAIWDYHVILSAQTDQGPVIYDFDSRLAFPVNLHTYIESSFRHWHQLPLEYRACFRAIDPMFYYKNFYSDRSHMAGLIDKSEYPDYPCITPQDKNNILTLDECRFVNDSRQGQSLIEPHEYAARFKP